MPPAEDAVVARVAGRLAEVPGAEAVALGGSRADGTHRPDSDWDFGLYYRGGLDPDGVRELGWEGEVFAPGRWGPVMNGGAWLTVDGRRVDVLFRDLDVVERAIAEARQGRFEVHPLPFHVAGIPTYVLAGELATSRVLHGDVPRPEYPEALRRSASAYWRRESELELWAAAEYARRADPIGCAGTLAKAVVEAAHSLLAARGIWALNEKRIVARAGLAEAAPLFARPGGDARELLATVERAKSVLRDAKDA